MRALVTGCAGFIGSHLTEKLLEQGFEVTGIDCFTEYYSREIKQRNIAHALRYENFKLIEKDILQMAQFPNVDYIFHQAAQAGVRSITITSPTYFLALDTTSAMKRSVLKQGTAAIILSRVVWGG